MSKKEKQERILELNLRLDELESLISGSRIEVDRQALQSQVNDLMAELEFYKTT